MADRTAPTPEAHTFYARQASTTRSGDDLGPPRPHGCGLAASPPRVCSVTAGQKRRPPLRRVPADAARRGEATTVLLQVDAPTMEACGLRGTGGGRHGPDRHHTARCDGCSKGSSFPAPTPLAHTHRIASSVSGLPLLPLLLLLAVAAACCRRCLLSPLPAVAAACCRCCLLSPLPAVAAACCCCLPWLLAFSLLPPLDVLHRRTR